MYIYLQGVGDQGESEGGFFVHNSVIAQRFGLLPCGVLLCEEHVQLAASISNEQLQAVGRKCHRLQNGW